MIVSLIINMTMICFIALKTILIPKPSIFKTYKILLSAIARLSKEMNKAAQVLHMCYMSTCTVCELFVRHNLAGDQAQGLFWFHSRPTWARHTRAQIGTYIDPHSPLEFGPTIINRDYSVYLSIFLWI